MPESVEFRLVSPKKRSRLRALREGVAPIYRNRLHRHFTDHSIEHCDRVANLAESLLLHLKRKLSDDEARILYGGAYLHDVGMHNERAGESGRMAKLLNDAGQSWTDIEWETKLDLIRRHHHEISADMVVASVRNGTPPIGFTLGDEDRPAEIAALCEAHCIDTGAPRYHHLVHKPEQRTMRLRLLTAILRLADILDEAHHRALVEQARVLELNTESKMHWWRHYYTREVEIDGDKNRVTIVFAFPAQKRDRYAKLVPALQVPWVEQEFERHRSVLAENSLSWHLSWVVQEAPFDTLEQMPPEVEAFMLGELARRKQLAARQSRVDLLAHFDESRAALMEQVRTVEANRTNVAAATYLEEILRLTTELWELGSHLTAQVQLRSALHFATSNGQSVDDQLHVRAAMRLAGMYAARDPRSSVTALVDVEAKAKALRDAAPEKVEFYQLLASLALRGGAFLQGREAAVEAIRLLDKDPATHEIRAVLAEATFIEGQRVPTQMMASPK